MATDLSPAKIVLLAVHYASNADIDSLALLAARNGTVLRKDLLLRIILSYLPEAVRSNEYVELIQAIESGDIPEKLSAELDLSPVEPLSENDAAKKVRKLRLLPLLWDEAPVDVADDFTALFLLRRAYKVDEEAGLLDELPTLLTPFLNHAPCIRTLMVSAILPLLRRNYEYYPQDPVPYTLSAFQHLSDRAAVDALLSRTGVREEDLSFVGRDLKSIVGPWLYNEQRWTRRREQSGKTEPPEANVDEDSLCPGWEQVLEWLTTQASKSWRVARSAVDQWDGPSEVDLGGYDQSWLSDEQQEHLEQTYARAALASAYLIPEASTEALEGAFTIVTKIGSLLDQDPSAPLATAASLLAPIALENGTALLSPRNATYLRNALLQEENILTAPNGNSTKLLEFIIQSAFLLTRGGCPCTVRRAGELVLIQDEREQKAEAQKLIHAMSNNGPNNDDKYWIRARNEILWLRDWGLEDDVPTGDKDSHVKGVFGHLTREFLEVEILKALLTNTRYTLARSLYEDSVEKPIPRKVLQDTIFTAAMNAYDNASNPNRTRGGVKKCDDIIHAFPKTTERSLAATQRIEALLKATHELSKYRLVLKQGEPFTPVVLRVHPDPLAILGRILEQNPRSHTRIQDLLDIGINMVEAGLTLRDKGGHSILTPEQEPAQRLLAERRVTAMCIDAALAEDDFETAYSYVVNRLSAISIIPTSKTQDQIEDDYSWRAALQAGQFRRSRPAPSHNTGTGFESSNPEIRHLEHRLECLATALRIAPPLTLHEILRAFRKAEEELDAAVRAEAEQENAWDAAADSFSGHGGAMPGGFGTPSPPVGAHRPGRPVKTTARGLEQQSGEEAAPMSLFDLSRASVTAAQRNLNLTSLANLQKSALGRLSGSVGSLGSSGAETETGASAPGAGDEQKRVRKRDQFRDAAMGTLVSGVGWLINAPAPQQERE